MLHTHSSVAAQAARLCAIATTGSWLKPHSGHTNRAPARIDHRERGVDSTQVSAANRDVWCIVLFWLLVRTRTRTRAQSDRTVLVLDCFAGRSYHSALVDALVRFVFAMGMDEWVSESRLRDEQMRSVHRAADRGADEPIEYEYRPLRRTEYEYDGIRWPVGQNESITKVEGLTQRKSARPTETFGASCCSGGSFVLVLVLSPTGRYSYSIALLIDCTIPTWSMHWFVSFLRWGWTNGYRNHGLRGEKMQSVHHVGDRCADEPIEYEYEYRPLQRTEYEYDGIRWPVGPNAAVQPEAVGKVSIRTRSIRRLAATDCYPVILGRHLFR
jgi:hypothetical protein